MRNRIDFPDDFNLLSIRVIPEEVSEQNLRILRIAAFVTGFRDGREKLGDFGECEIEFHGWTLFCEEIPGEDHISVWVIGQDTSREDFEQKVADRVSLVQIVRGLWRLQKQHWFD